MSVFTQISFNDVLVSGVIDQCPEQRSLGLSVPVLCFTFDDGTSMGMRFPSPTALIEFCKKHRFECEDNRYQDIAIPKGVDYGKQNIWVGGFDHGVRDYLAFTFNGVPIPTRSGDELFSKMGESGYTRGMEVMKKIIDEMGVNHVPR